MSMMAPRKQKRTEIDIPDDREYDREADAELDQALVDAIAAAEAADNDYLARVLQCELGSHYYGNHK